MAITKVELIKRFKELKNSLGVVPSQRQFLAETGISDRALKSAYGSKAYSKLVIDCGEQPNSFNTDKYSEDHILEQYGNLILINKELPVSADWSFNKCTPDTSALRQRGIQWSALKNMFLDFAKEKPEWNEAIQIIKEKNPIVLLPSKEKNIKGCYVYLMYDKRTKLYKIGISNTPEFREKTLQSEQPLIELIAAKKYINRRIAANIEKALHETYSHKRKRGEWFILDKEEIEEIVDTLS